MIHIGNNTKSTIVSKGISAGHAQNAYRGLVRVMPQANNARNHTQCDSLLIGGTCGAHTFPYIEGKNPSAIIEHEATTSKISEDQVVIVPIYRNDEQFELVSEVAKEVMKELRTKRFRVRSRRQRHL